MKRTVGSAPLMRSASPESLFLDHRPCIVERPAEAAHQFVDFTLADDQRRTEGNDIAWHVTQYRPVVLRAAHEIRRDAGFGVEALLGRLIADELHGADQPDAARLADQRMVGVAADSCLQP